MAEALARDVVADHTSALGGRLDRFAGRVGARYDGFGLGGFDAPRPLADTVADRWVLPTALDGGIDVFSGADLGALTHEWGGVEGYEHSDFDALAGRPFVYPVDPVSHPTGLRGHQLGRGRRARATRPVTVGARRDERPMPTERWRRTSREDRRLSPYPAAMGNAGAIEPDLLRFQDARAEVIAGTRRAIVADPGPGRDWGHTGGLAPVADRAEAMVDAIEARTDPAAPAPVDVWLVPDTTLVQMPRVAAQTRRAQGPMSRAVTTGTATAGTATAGTATAGTATARPAARRPGEGPGPAEPASWPRGARPEGAQLGGGAPARATAPSAVFGARTRRPASWHRSGEVPMVPVLLDARRRRVRAAEPAGAPPTTAATAGLSAPTSPVSAPSSARATARQQEQAPSSAGASRQAAATTGAGFAPTWEPARARAVLTRGAVVDPRAAWVRTPRSLASSTHALESTRGLSRRPTAPAQRHALPLVRPASPKGRPTPGPTRPAQATRRDRVADTPRAPLGGGPTSNAHRGAPRQPTIGGAAPIPHGSPASPTLARGARTGPPTLGGRRPMLGGLAVPPGASPGAPAIGGRLSVPRQRPLIGGRFEAPTISAGARPGPGAIEPAARGAYASIDRALVVSRAGLAAGRSRATLQTPPTTAPSLGARREAAARGEANRALVAMGVAPRFAETIAARFEETMRLAASTPPTDPRRASPRLAPSALRPLLTPPRPLTMGRPSTAPPTDRSAGPGSLAAPSTHLARPGGPTPWRPGGAPGALVEPISAATRYASPGLHERAPSAARTSSVEPRSIRGGPGPRGDQPGAFVADRRLQTTPWRGPRLHQGAAPDAIGGRATLATRFPTAHMTSPTVAMLASTAPAGVLLRALGLAPSARSAAPSTPAPRATPTTAAPFGSAPAMTAHLDLGSAPATAAHAGSVPRTAASRGPASLASAAIGAERFADVRGFAAPRLAERAPGAQRFQTSATLVQPWGRARADSAPTSVDPRAKPATAPRTPRTAPASQAMQLIEPRWLPASTRGPGSGSPHAPGRTGVAAEHLVRQVEARAADPIEGAAPRGPEGVQRFEGGSAEMVPVEPEGRGRAAATVEAAAMREVSQASAQAAELLRPRPSRRQAPANVRRALATAAQASPGARPRSPSEASRELIEMQGADGASSRPAPASSGRLFGDRGPASVSAPRTKASRLLVEVGNRPASGQAMRSTPGQRPARKAETGEEARHRLASQIDSSMSTEEVDRVARDVIDQLGRWLEFDAQRVGEDEWD